VLSRYPLTRAQRTCQVYHGPMLPTLLLFMLFCALVATFVIRTAREQNSAKRVRREADFDQSLLDAVAWLRRRRS
jgi:hypothetical protein